MAGQPWRSLSFDPSRPATGTGHIDQIATPGEIDRYPVGVVFFDLVGGVLDANDAFLSMIGFSRADLEAGGVRYEYLTPPEWRWRDEQTIAELKATGRAGPFEKEYTHKDGHLFWILCCDKMLDDGTAVEIVIDVTERKRAEAALREGEARYRTLFASIDQGFCVVEVGSDGGRTDYRVVEANPAFYRQTGFPKAILGCWLREAAPGLEEHWFEIYGGVARTGECGTGGPCKRQAR